MVIDVIHHTFEGSGMQIVNELKRPKFWFKKMACHPCCWIPLASGGSVQLLQSHNSGIELGIGAGLIIAVEEGSRFIDKKRQERAQLQHAQVEQGQEILSGSDSDTESDISTSHQPLSRKKAYAVAGALFLASYGASHAVFPHGEHEDPCADHHHHGQPADIPSFATPYYLEYADPCHES